MRGIEGEGGKKEGGSIEEVQKKIIRCGECRLVIMMAEM